MALSFFKNNSSDSFRINSNIWLLTINDIFTWGVSYVVTILVGLYMAQRLDKNVTEMIGIGVAVVFVARGIFQIPMGILGDRLKSDRDEVIMLMIGNLFMGIATLSLTQVTSEIHYYTLQVLFGFGASLNIVDWRKLFAKNLDKGKEGMEYAIYDSIMSFAIAILGVLGGYVANISAMHFDYVIGGIGLIIIGSNIWIMLIYMAQEAAEKKLQIGVEVTPQ